MDVVTLGAAIAIAGSGGSGGGGDLPSGGSAGDLLEKTANGSKWSGDIPTAVAGKLAAPAAAGTAGQVLALNNNLAPAWVDPTPSPAVTVETPASGSTFTLSPCPVTYSFGEKAELTVTVTATSQYHFMFSCPSGAATVLTMNGITGTTGDTLAAGKVYEVDIWAGIAFIKEIEVTPVT